MTTSFYPVLMSRDVPAAADFYRSVLGFETTFDCGWYHSLRLDRFELALVAHDHPTVPEGYRASSQGVLLNLEVEDVDSLHSRLTGAGHQPVRSLRDEGFGQRHFMIAAPDDVLLDIIQPIAPTEEFVDAYAPA